MPAARTFSPPITAKAATRSDTLKMIALTRLDMMMRISFVLDVAGPLLAYLHYISTFGCAPVVPGCKSATLIEPRRGGISIAQDVSPGLAAKRILPLCRRLLACPERPKVVEWAQRSGA